MLRDQTGLSNETVNQDDVELVLTKSSEITEREHDSRSSNQNSLEFPPSSEYDAYEKETDSDGKEEGTLEEPHSEQEDPGLQSFNRRFAILFSFSFTYFLWTMTESRTVTLAPSFAKYYNVHNNAISDDGELGIDFLSVFGNLVIIFSYMVAVWVVDRKGLFLSLSLGNIGLCVASWIWVLSGKSFTGVIVSKGIAALLGPLVSGSLLAVSNRWFPEQERARATAVGSFGSLMGAGAAILLGPVFEVGPMVVDFELKSCRSEQIPAIEIALIESQNFTVYKFGPPCNATALRETINNFCCYTPADIEGINILMAILLTVATVICLVVVKDRPPQSPSYGGMQKLQTKDYFRVAKDLLQNPRFMLLNLSDFIIGGMPTVAFVSVSRILPAEVQGFDFIVAAIGLVVAIPFCIFFSAVLDRRRFFYEFTIGAYLVGAVVWSIAAIGFEMNSGGLGCDSEACQQAGAYIVLVCIGIAFIDTITWAVSEYELKMEYTFDPDVDVEGAVVSIDRIVENLNGLVFVTIFAPERFVHGSRDVVVYGTLVMWLGVLPALFIKGKTEYRRIDFEKEERNRREL